MIKANMMMNRCAALAHPPCGIGTVSMFALKAHDLIQKLLSKGNIRWKIYIPYISTNTLIETTLITFLKTQRDDKI
jgi:hypothetical protein